MPKEVAETQTNSLTDFSFDDNEFFGIKGSGDNESQTSKTIKELKDSSSPFDNEEDDDTDDLEVTNIDDENKKSSGKTKEPVEEVGGGTSNKTKPKEKEKVREDDEEEEEPVFFAEEDETKKDKTKPVKKTKEEDDDDDESLEDDKKNIKDTKVTKKGKDSDDNSGNSNDDNDDKFFTTLAGELKEKGVFQNVEIKEGEDITEEKFFELQEGEIEARVEETFEAFFEEMDEDGKDFLKFKKAGGKTVDFLAIYGATVDLAKFDEDDAEQRQQILTYYLTTVEQLDAEELKDRLQYLKDNGSEKKYAKKWFDNIKETEEKQRKALIETEEKAQIARENKAKKFNTELVQVLSKTESVGVFPISKTEHKELGDYFTKPVVKVGKNRYIPQIQADLAKVLRAEDEETKKDLLILGKLLKNKFNVKDLVDKVETKVAKSVKSKLQETKRGSKPHSSASSTRKSIADYFQE